MANLDPNRLRDMNRYWQAANYLTIGQIYLQENPLLREPLRPEHIKPRLLGHWGTSPGLSFIYVHLNRLIQDTDADVIYLTGPGHGGPALVANAYLDGTYSEIYPEVSQDTAGLRRLFRQFSTPGGIPSHDSVTTPGSIHEGGELGYVLAHAFGAVFDNPDLIAVAVVGDGEAETGPLEGSWKSIKFLNPVRDGAVLPVLHLNGYKISGPTVLGRDRDEDIQKLLEAHGYEVHWVEGVDPLPMHQAFAATLDTCYAKIRAIQAEARAEGFSKRPTWPGQPAAAAIAEEVSAEGFSKRAAWPNPDVVLASAGDIPTLEIVAAAWLLRKHAPSLKVRVVNVVDLMCLPPPATHPHGLEEAKFIELFTQAKPVVLAQPFYRCRAGQSGGGGIKGRGAAVEVRTGRTLGPRSRMNPCPATSVEIIVDLPPGITLGEYERIGEGQLLSCSLGFPR